ncbi:MAG: site-2 protease family protein [Oscillospiraceae bacterium]|jgi:Zn-dependent protease|nr:site-2 protease family protein [Oscillospiraceae bacterium]
MFNFDLENINMLEVLCGFLVRIIIIVAILPLHECAHGWVAKKLGDPTAQMLGRVTLNPVKHIEPTGAILLILFGFGWAKPVPVYSGNFRMKNKKLGMAITAAAGPLSNFIAAFVGVIILKLVSLGLAQSNPELYFNLFVYVFGPFILVNLSLMLFNLIPIQPLDGSRILSVLLPDKWIYQIESFIRKITDIHPALYFVGFYIILNFLGVFTLIGWGASGIFNGFIHLFGVV